MTVTPLTGSRLDAYLARIRYEGPREPTAQMLRALHRAHQFAIPFENLDIHIGRRIELSVDRFFDKIVRAGRGGFCYELNGLFAAALAGLGFQVSMLSARVFTPDGFTPEFDHMVLLVDGGEQWLADVGFGDSVLDPVRLRHDEPVHDGRARYRLLHDAETWELQVEHERWDPAFRFTERAHPLDAFVPRCDFLQTSPSSIFVQRRVCSLPTENGRITLSQDRFIVTEHDARREEQVDDETFTQLLRERFGIVLS